MTTWEDSDSGSNSSANEHDNHCLIVDTEEVIYKSNSIFYKVSNSPHLSSNEDEDNGISFEDLLTRCNSISEKYLELKQRFC